jgi:hypothetical protein
MMSVGFQFLIVIDLRFHCVAIPTIVFATLEQNIH